MSWVRWRLLTLKLWRSEWGAGWSVARSFACDAAGGHRWGAVTHSDTMQGYGRECSRCGTWESARTTAGSSAANTLWLDVTAASQPPDLGEGDDHA